MTENDPSTTDETTTKPKAAKPSGILARATHSAAGRERQGGEKFVFRIRDEVAELLEGSPFEVDSYLQAVVREIEKQPKLRDACNEAPESVLGAVMLGATLQLPIGGPLGQFYLTPRNEKQGDGWRTVCVPMIGYRGFFELGYRSGKIQSFDYIIVREGDVFELGGSSERGKFFTWQQYADGEYDELDENGKKRELRGVVAIAYPTNGGRPAFQYLSKAAIDARKPKRTQNTPWEGPHFEAMYVKTPHRELAKYLELSIQTAKAVEADETISLWNRATSSLDTLQPDQTAITTGDEPGIVADEHETAARGSQDAEPAPEPVPAAARPAQRDSRPRTKPVQDGPASNYTHPSDLPALARSQNRDMTDEEYDRFSAWEAEQAMGGGRA